MAVTLANAIALITKYGEKGWDAVYKEDARISLLAPNEDSRRVKFSLENAKRIKVAKLTLGGLSDYDRNNIETGSPEGLLPDSFPAVERGYKKAAAALTWEERELTQDRAAQYVIEMMDDEETNGLAVGSTTAEVGRTVVVPEVDAYAFAKLFSDVSAYNLGNVVNGSIASTPYAAFVDGNKWLDDHEVGTENRIAFCSTSYLAALKKSNEITKWLDVESKLDHKVSFKVTELDGVKLISVPPARFKTVFNKRPNGGWYGSGDDIDFILMDSAAAVHVTKYRTQRVLSGDLALAATGMDSTCVYYRIYHDLFVFDNKAQGIFIHYGGLSAVSGLNDFSVILNADGVIVAQMEQPAGELTRIYLTERTSETTPALPVAVDGVWPAWTTNITYDHVIGEGSAFTAAGTYTLVGVRGGQVIGVKTLTITGNQGEFTYALADAA